MRNERQRNEMAPRVRLHTEGRAGHSTMAGAAVPPPSYRNGEAITTMRSITVSDDRPRKVFVPRMISIKEAEAATGLSYNYLRGLCLSRRVARLRIANGKWMINADSLAEYLNGGGADE